MRCSGNLIGDPPIDRVGLNNAMFAGRGCRSGQKMFELVDLERTKGS